MNFEEWNALSKEEKEVMLKMAEDIDKRNKSLLRSYRYYSNKKEREEKEEKD